MSTGTRLKNKSLTGKFSLQEALHCASSCGISSYAATYLLAKGFTASAVGFILFFAYTLSFFLQPLLASFIDKKGCAVLPKVMTACGITEIACVASFGFIKLPRPVFIALYIISLMILDMQTPVMNSLSVYYNEHGININYGVGRGMGCAGFSVASLSIGSIMNNTSVNLMPPIVMLLILVYVINANTYPKIEKDTPVRKTSNKNGINLWQFFKKYKWYTISLLGILFIAMVHVMIENYLINLMTTLGGNSSNVGIALFCATLTEIPVMCLFGKIHDRLGSRMILFTGGFFYIAKALLLCFAGSITDVYCIQFMQAITFVMISPVQVYYANECTDLTDMVKGQSIITAAYTFGVAFGDLFGGILVSNFGIKTMLTGAAVIATCGFAVFLAAVPKALSNGKRNINKEAKIINDKRNQEKNNK